MYEIIIDVTNKCYLNCTLCGTNADKQGQIILEKEHICEIIKYAQNKPAKVFLGGGCFFCHPDCTVILEYTKSIQSNNVVIDIPLCPETFYMLKQYPMNLYHYSVSVSLWGINETHNRLSDSMNYSSIYAFLNLMYEYQNHAAISFVITNDIIAQKDDIINFLSTLRSNDYVYFHRLMPTGRSSSSNLPKYNDIVSFMQTIQASNHTCIIQPHHTIKQHLCTAYTNRIFVDWYGDIYGCGWVGSNKSIGNIHTDDFSHVLSLCHQYKGTYICPLYMNVSQ